MRALFCLAFEKNTSPMSLILAPMEGLVDQYMRTLLTADGPFDHCVTEFLRVVDRLLPERVFHRLCPESLNGWKTPSGTPVHLQLLGSDAIAMSENACRGAELGAPVIDINFGCPSKTVNKNMGGAILLREPERIYRILSAIRHAFPAHIPLTAKMRLGFDDKSLAIENAQAVAAAGVSELCIHARTKLEGYKPPAHWQWIARIKQHITIPVTANGEVWNLEDYLACKAASDCDQIMIGRGAVAQPDLARWITAHEQGQYYTPLPWQAIAPLLHSMLDLMAADGEAHYSVPRVKQWLAFLKLTYPQANLFFEETKRLRTTDDMRAAIDRACLSAT